MSSAVVPVPTHFHVEPTYAKKQSKCSNRNHWVPLRGPQRVLCIVWDSLWHILSDGRPYDSQGEHPLGNDILIKSIENPYCTQSS